MQPTTRDTQVIRLRTRNHPGVMSHVVGLFARRGFNVEGIVCMPTGDGRESTMLLLVRAADRLGQLLRQLAKLEDVLEAAAAPERRGAFASAARELV